MPCKAHFIYHYRWKPSGKRIPFSTTQLGEVRVQAEGTIQVEIKYTSLQSIFKGCCLLFNLQCHVFDAWYTSQICAYQLLQSSLTLQNKEVRASDLRPARRVPTFLWEGSIKQKAKGLLCPDFKAREWKESSYKSSEAKINKSSRTLLCWVLAEQARLSLRTAGLLTGQMCTILSPAFSYHNNIHINENRKSKPLWKKRNREGPYRSLLLN